MVLKNRLDKLEKIVLSRGKKPDFRDGSYFLSKNNGETVISYKGADITGTNEAKALLERLGPEFTEELGKFLMPVEVFVLPKSEVLIIEDTELKECAVWVPIESKVS